ncbi:MAG TPA: PAS domain-containing sensor histidine kinase [Candidatus Dormibacteraeota bacterium]
MASTESGPGAAPAESGGESHQLVDLTFDAIFARGFYNRLISYWNPGAERLYGWSRAEALGRVSGQLLESEYPIPLEEIETELLRSGRWEGEIKQRRKDGSPVVVAGRWGLQTHPDGSPLAILEINSDLTTIRGTTEDLRRSEQMFSLLVSGVKDYAIFMLDTDGVVASWNDGAERIKGYAANEIVGRHFSTFYMPEEVKAGKPDWELEVARREGRYQEEGWRVRKDGSTFWASVLITALYDKEGVLKGFGKVTRDMTERHQAELRREEERDLEAAQLRSHAERMAELERTKTQFLNLASHELRGPLTVVRGYTSMLEDGSIAPERFKEMAPLIESKLAQIDILIEQMLETSRLEHDQLELHPEVFDLRGLAREQAALFSALSARHHIAVVVDAEPVMVSADRSRIGTIIGNMLDNAVKYSPNGGDIECKVSRSDDSALVRIRDHGLGIRPEHLPLLFGRFSRLPTEENVSIQGTGLGLFLCREIALRHGGDVAVRSTLGEGSEFTLRLPVAG